MSDEQVLEQARAVWRAAMERDDAFAAVARQGRLAQTAPIPRARLAVAGPVPLHAVVALVVIAVAGWVRGAPSAPSPLPARASASLEPVAPSPVQAGTNAGEAPPAQAQSSAQRRPLVALAPCFGCTRAGSDAASVRAGERLVPGERVQVPPGATLILCWGIDADEGSHVTVSGPATIVVKSTGDVTIERADAQQAPSALSRDQPAAEDPFVRWRAAQEALGAGDRLTAERHLRALLAMAGVGEDLRERASFSVAELELARGAKVQARKRLEGVRATADASLGADVVFLEARVADSPRARAAVIARYLATDPPSPYRERAMADEGLALLDAGDLAGARASAAALRARGHLPDVAVVALERLERELATRSPER
jgi:hypothetical protein